VAEVRRPLSSVRARAALAAATVVAVALLIAGLAILFTLRSSLTRQADLQAEVAARDVAAQFAVGVPAGRLALPDARDHPTQVIAEDGRVLAASENLKAITGAAVGGRAAAPPGGGVDDGSGSGGPGGGHGGGHGGDDDGGDRGGGDDGDDDSGGDDDGGRDDPGRGQVSADVDYAGGRATIAATRGASPPETAAEYRFAAVEATSPAGLTATVYSGTGLTPEVMTTVTRSMLVGFGLLVLVVATMTWLTTRRALRPVEGIRAEMAEITSSTDLTRRVPVPASGDEVADLATTTNETLAALERSVERQRRFVADASHELRSPIASLRTQLEVSSAHPELLDLDGLVDDTVRLQHLAADLLLLARLDAGEPVTDTTVELAGLVREEADHRSGDGAVPIALHLHDRPDVRGSRTRLTRVVANLLDNAQRHAAGAVTVTLRAADATAVLEVSDDGPGIPADDRERVFERFVRLDHARDRDQGGTGLGLAIARDIVTAHGGTITAGPAAGGGARFEVRLPARHG
jgi:signal transduction histidine kinase